MQELKVKIKGMHCGSCEVLIEQRWKKLEGVHDVKVNYAKGEATIHCSDASEAPSLEALHDAVKAQGYQILRAEETQQHHLSKKKEYLELGAIVLVLVGLYVVLKQFNLFPDLGISEGMGYGLIFLLGLVAAITTCMAVTGGLLLTVATKYNQLHPELSGKQKFKPHIFFNLGRLTSYAILGGLVGALGSFFTLSSQLSGILLVVISILMIILGAQMLFPHLSRFHLKMPKFIAHKLYENAHYEHPTAPFLFGAATFFLPCGFTQALQLYVLSSGSFVTGALTMFVFALGTMPGLLSLGAVTSFSKGKVQHYISKTAAVLIVLIGILNISSGLALTGVVTGTPLIPQVDAQVGGVAGSFGADAKHSGQFATQFIDPNVQMIDGKQIVNMAVVGYEYEPYRFKILQGVPVEWVVDGTRAQGCAQALLAPKLKIQEYLAKGTKTIRFTANQPGFIPFHCSMGMTTPGAGFEVVKA